MKNFIILFFFCFVAIGLHAQEGRYEMPSDTMSIGGEIQEEKMNRMQGREELLNEFIVLRDSLKIFQSKSPQNAPRKQSEKIEEPKQNIASMLRDVNQWIETLEQKKNDAPIQKEAYTVLHDTRRKFKEAQKTADSPSLQKQ